MAEAELVVVFMVMVVIVIVVMIVMRGRDGGMDGMAGWDEVDMVGWRGKLYGVPPPPSPHLRREDAIGWMEWKGERDLRFDLDDGHFCG